MLASLSRPTLLAMVALAMLLPVHSIRADEAQDQAKRDSDNQAAIAKNQAEIATSAAAAQASLAKAQAEAAKAQQDYYKSIIPDPSKYQVSGPMGPKLAAAGTRLAFEETTTLAATVATLVGQATGAADRKPEKLKECVNKVSVVRADAGTRPLLAQSLSVRSTLEFATKKLKQQREALDTLVKERVETQVPKNRPMTDFGGVVAVGELAASFATILKSKYAFDTVSQTALAGGVLAAKVYEALASDPCISVLEPDAILSLATLSCDAEKIDADWAEELKRVWRLCQEVVQDRATVKNAFAEATGRLQKQDTKARKNQDLEASAKKLEDGAKRLSDLADEAEKSLTALFALDAQGNSLIDAAIRGGILREILKGTGVFSLTLKTLSSDVDVVARDCLFCTLRVNLASNTVVSWLLVDHKGKVRTTGAIRKDTPMERIQLP